MRRARGAPVAGVRTTLVIAALLVAGCGDDTGGNSANEDLCLTVQAWSDATVDAVNAFRVASRELDADARRARYAETFTDLAGIRDQFGEQLDGLDLADPVASRLEEALIVVDQTIADGASEAAALPDDAYELVSVSEGSLVTGVEKAKAVVFQALSELADESVAGIPRGCGRRGALDLSPSATYP